MSEQNKDEILEPTPEAQAANWDLGKVEATPEQTDLLPPAAEATGETFELPTDLSLPVESQIIPAEPEILPESPTVSDVDAELTSEPVAEDAVSEADIFLPAQETPEADVPRDPLFMREMPESEPTRRSFDFAQLSEGEAETPAEPVQELDPVLADLEVTEVEVATAEEAVDVETTAVTRKALLERAQVEAEEAVSAWKPREEDLPVSENTTELILGDTSVPLVLPSRVSARVWSFFMTLLGAPVAWYLISDAAARFTLADNSPFKTGQLNYAACIEFTAGALIAVVLLSFLVRSSLGALFSGLAVMVVGAPFLLVPGLTKEILQPAIDWLTSWNDFGANLAHHLNWTGYTGAIFIAGLFLFVMGIIAILARRDGRREQEIRAQIERYSPETIKKRRRK